MIKDIPLLLVEDDNRLAAMIKGYLDKNGFRVTCEGRGDRAEARVAECSPKLIILDLMLPGMDGFSICRAIRHHYSGLILMLTAKGEDIDQVVGLELGADDYVTKPVTPRVLLARIEALLRRSPELHSAETTKETDMSSGNMTFGNLTIDMRQRSVELGGQPVDLTTSEFNLLGLLASREGDVVSRDDIYREVKGVEYDGLDRSVDVFVSRLRKKLGDSPRRPEKIKTVWAAGYLFVKTAWGDHE